MDFLTTVYMSIVPCRILEPSGLRRLPDFAYLYKVKKSNEQDIGSALKQLFKSYHLDEKLNAVRIKEMWGEIMGKSIQAYTSDIRFKDGILTIWISSAPLKQDLLFSREQIATRINDEIGERVVREVLIR